jgi:hypothetical protein
LHASFRRKHGIAGIERPGIQAEISRRFGQLLDYYSSHHYTFYLQAHDAKTGATLASATCTSDIRGTQIALNVTPPNGSEATLAAR